MDISLLPAERAREDNGVPVTIFEMTKKPYLAPREGYARSYATLEEIPEDARDDYEQLGEKWVAKTCTITVLGSHSKKVRNAQTESTRELVKKMRKNRNEDDGESTRIAVAAAAITDWFGWRLNGEPWPCTPENVRALLVTPWILDQVEAAVHEHASFFEPSSS